MKLKTLLMLSFLLLSFKLYSQVITISKLKKADLAKYSYMYFAINSTIHATATCFFISINDKVYLVTARHCLLDDNNKALWKFINISYGVINGRLDQDIIYYNLKTLMQYPKIDIVLVPISRISAYANVIKIAINKHFKEKLDENNIEFIGFPKSKGETPTTLPTTIDGKIIRQFSVVDSQHWIQTIDVHGEPGSSGSPVYNFHTNGSISLIGVYMGRSGYYNNWGNFCNLYALSKML